jgi:hypothetical protein
VLLVLGCCGACGIGDGGVACANADPTARGIGVAGTGVTGTVVNVAPLASSGSVGIESPDSNGGNALSLCDPHRSHDHERDDAANLRRSSGGYSRAPIAPSAGVGMNEINATRAVRTAHQEHCG